VQLFRQDLPPGRKQQRWGFANELCSAPVSSEWTAYRAPGDGYVFIDEFAGTDYCALFYSERYWKEHFDRTPPGLIGAATGRALGEYYIGPWSERGDHPMQHATGAAYTRKSMSGHWTYYPPDAGI
jgi:hypothetical protein